MTLVTLSDLLRPALENNYAVAGLVVLGWEDARAYVAAAEAENAPVILQAGPDCRANMPLPVLGKMFRCLAEAASVPVAAHLDHGHTMEECREAIDCGFSSVMFDGSRKPLNQNIDETARIAEMAHAAGISIEGEIGFVGYSEGEASAGTSPDEARRFAQESGVDAMAVSIGNVHLQQQKESLLDLDRLTAIEAVTNLPLVIHGGSGIPLKMRADLARNSRICKFNSGTELRMVFGQALRTAVNADLNRFDRIAILNETHDPVRDAAQVIIRSFGAPPQRQD